MLKKRLLSIFLAVVMCMGFSSNLAALSAPSESGSFLAGTMDDQWKILRPMVTGNLGFELVKGRGLKLMSVAAGMQSTPDNTFTRPAPVGDTWEAVAKVYYPIAPNQNYQQLCFGVMQDDNNYIKVDVEYNSSYTGRIVQFSINNNGTYTHTHRTYLSNAVFPAEVNANRANDLVAYYKITKTAPNVYRASISFNGVDFVTVGARNGTSGGSNTNGEYTVNYAEPKLFAAAINDTATASPLECYIEYIKVNPTDILAEDFANVVDYVAENIPSTVSDNITIIPPVPYGYTITATSSNKAIISDDGAVTLPAANANVQYSYTVSDGTRSADKRVNIAVRPVKPVTVEFYYNYTTGAPTTRPASFTKTTGANGKLTSLPIEQTLPQYGARADYGFVGWYDNPEGTGEKVTLDTVFAQNTNLYAKWEETPSLWREYDGYFLMGSFRDYAYNANPNVGASNAYIWNKHYNVLCPVNNFKLTNIFSASNSRTAFTTARTNILADSTLTDAEKQEKIARANEDVVLNPNPAVISTLNAIRNWNNAHPDQKKYARFHTVMWHGGQQPDAFFGNGFTGGVTAQWNYRDEPWTSSQDGAIASRETMKARITNYINAAMNRFKEYSDIIVSWDIMNEPVDDFSGQIRNYNGVPNAVFPQGDASSQGGGQWGRVWHDKHPARNLDGTLKFTTPKDSMNVVHNQDRLYDESEFIRWAFEAAAKWIKDNDINWPLYVNDYMDSNKPYTKLQPTFDVVNWIKDDVDMQGAQVVYGFQGRLAWAYPTVEMLQKQVNDALEVADMIGVTEGDIRTDFEPNPFWDPNQPTVPVNSTHTPQWNYNDLNSGSGSSSNPAPGTLMNTFDAHNAPSRRMPEWNTGNGMINVTTNRVNNSAIDGRSYNITSNGELFAISEQNMKNQADFAADWLDMLVARANKVELFQWDGESDSGTFNNSKGAHIWVTGVSGRTSGQYFEKYSFWAVAGSPNRDKLKTAINAFPQSYWVNHLDICKKAQELLNKRIYTLEGLNDVKDMTAFLNAELAAGDIAYITYDPNGGTGSTIIEQQNKSLAYSAKAPLAIGISRPGYAFTGWTTSSNGIGTVYGAGESVPLTASVRLYAQWKKDPTSFTVKFESYNKGTGATLNNTEIPAMSIVKGGKIPKPAMPYKPGYVFAGWFRDMALTREWNFATDTVNENMRLYAAYTEGESTEPVTVEFYYNYTGAPAARPASFTKRTGSDGKLVSFPVEQTLPQYGARADYGFVGWYDNPEGTGEKYTLDTVFTKNTNLYAKWEVTPSLWQEYDGYFLMGAFRDYSYNANPNVGAQNAYIWNKHYNILCPSNNFKLTNIFSAANSRTAFTTARTNILADDSLTDEEKQEQIARANEAVVLNPNPTVLNQLNAIRNWNNAHPDQKKYTRFHTVMWHGGQQPDAFFGNGFTGGVTAQWNFRDEPWTVSQDGAIASRETMKARITNYINAVMNRFKEYSDIIVSWDIMNEPVDDFSGQIRNYNSIPNPVFPQGDSSSQAGGQWGRIWHDKHPALNPDGTLKFTTPKDSMNVVHDQDRLYDESEFIRWAYEAAAKWIKDNNMNWPLYVNDYMDSNKPYTKLQPTFDVVNWIKDDVDMQGTQVVYGFQGRLAWAYPTIEMLQKQVNDALDVADMIGVTEGDIRTDFEPNPFWDPSKPTVPVNATHTPQWNYNDLNSGSGSFSNPTSGTLMNTFDAHNGPTRRMPEWNTGNGMINVTTNRVNNSAIDGRSYNITANGELFAISEQNMKNQADFAADWMDMLVARADKVELFQWDGESDSGTFNSSKGAQMWVTGVSGRTTSQFFEKYSFWAVVGSPNRDKLKTAINAFPPSYWEANADKYDKVQALLNKRIYTLEGVNDVKAMTASLTADLAALDKTYITYDANGGTGAATTEEYAKNAAAVAKAPSAVGISREGYELTGWNTKSNGIGRTYAPGEALDTSVSVRLYAVWEKAPKTATVKFENYNYGTGATLDYTKVPGGTPDAVVTIGSKVARPADPVKVGSFFEGWCRDMALTKLWDFDNDVVTANMRLYAKWSEYSFAYSGIKAEGIVPGNTLYVSLDTAIKNNAPASLLVALYGADGRLISVVHDKGTVADGRIKFGARLDIPADVQSDSYIKTFLWDAESKPYNEIINFSYDGVIE